MDLASLVNTWGLCKSYPEMIEERTDTADVRRWRDVQPHWLTHGTIFQCIAVENQRLILTNGFKIFRTEPETYTQMKAATFQWGDVVYLRKKLDRPRCVIDLGYHWQNHMIIYRVEISNMLNIVYWFDHQLIAAREIDSD
ncbi:MAG: hypothetical protein HY862_19835 [Chloroflexi bacterium]|nr:hypothetical protein [Chloroflexota bacterium]